MTSTPPPPDSHHDALFRYAFSRAELAQGELRSVLPHAVVDALDFGTLRVEPGTLVDTEHAALETDLLYRVDLSGHPAFVFILFEHQSQPDPRMPWRMLRYMVRIWDRFLRDESDSKLNLPLIIPLVLHNGLRPWNTARSLRRVCAGRTVGQYAGMPTFDSRAADVVDRMVSERRKRLQLGDTAFTRLTDAEASALSGHLSPIRISPEFLLCVGCRGIPPGPLLMALEETFGRSSPSFDDYKGSYAFPLLVSSKDVEQRHVLRVYDHRGGLTLSLYRVEPYEPKMRTMYVGDATPTLMALLEGFHEFMELRALWWASYRSKGVQPFARSVESELLVYGHDGELFFAQTHKDASSFAQAKKRLRSVVDTAALVADVENN